MAFRDNLRETLDFVGMEQKELAAKTGLSLKTIENYVKKDSSLPSADKAVIIAQALGVTVEYLVNGKKTKEETPPTIPPQHIEVIDIVSKLNKTNYEVITNVAKTLLNIQTKNKFPGIEG
jgi:transcriptional regulator with XRE-family HTH domain